MMNRPEEIHHISRSQFSVARHFGGCTFNGAEYVYDSENDKLVRKDIQLARQAKCKSEAKRMAEQERARWLRANQSFAGF
jgi:hypothetical protein